MKNIFEYRILTLNIFDEGNMNMFYLIGGNQSEVRTWTEIPKANILVKIHSNFTMVGIDKQCAVHKLILNEDL